MRKSPPPPPIDRRPRLRNTWDFLASVAADLHAKRVVGYPEQIVQGRMSQSSADTAIRLAALIADDWRIAAAGGTIERMTSRHDRVARIATLQAARDLTASRADRATIALRKALPPGNPLPERDLILMDLREGRHVSDAVDTWLRATDYAAGVAALLWWEECRGGRLDVVCTINAQLRGERPIAEQARAA